MSTPSSPNAVPRSWWGDRTVKMKILTAVAVSATATAVVGLMGIQALGNASASADVLYRSNAQGVAAAGGIYIAATNISLNARDTMLATGPADAATDVAALDGLGTAFDQAIQTYSATGLDAANKPIVDELVATMAKYRSYLKQSLAPLAVAGNLRQWVVVNDAQGRL